MLSQLNKDEPRNALLTWLNTVEIVSVERISETTGRAVYRFPVQRQYLNPTMTLHGGLSSAMFDAATTWVLDVIRKPGFWMMFGTSRNLNMTFLRPAVEGEMLLMDCEVSVVVGLCHFAWMC
jgi:acyl-coenzyme A thioesterase 13